MSTVTNEGIASRCDGCGRAQYVPGGRGRVWNDNRVTDHGRESHDMNDDLKSQVENHDNDGFFTDYDTFPQDICFVF